MTTEDEIGQRGYQYRHGDRPLDGYTIDRAAGRGGFGEVYYAHSDSGREVALKVVNTYEQVELRGISQCMNLKNPHLVTIFDVKYGSDGRPWVIMEYVAGPSLREILDGAPSGLGTAKAAFFLREVGKGLTYLHDCGIVHRDLKPGNIFYENGYVKIGDYGLSKAMSMTRHSGQTVAVGTLHYMAPEIGEGKYDRSIDIYALGALLYEMLTGQVPFLGSSPAEVLMKHLRSEVNLEGLEEPFKSVVRKAMAKNPDDRYRSVQEMVEAVFGSEQVRDSVSQFSPASISMKTGQAARNIGDGGAAETLDPFEELKTMKRRWKQGNKHAWQAWAKNPFSWRRAGAAIEPDRLPLLARISMAVGVAFLTALAAASLGQHRDSFADGTGIFFAILAATAAATIAWHFVGRNVERESEWVRRLAIGTPVALAVWPFAYAITRYHREDAVFACCATLFLICWNRRRSPWRKERVSVGDAFTAGLCAFVVSIIFSTPSLPIMGVAVGTSLAVSLLSPWGQVTARKAANAAAAAVPPPAPWAGGFPPPPAVPPPVPGVGGFAPPSAPTVIRPPADTSQQQMPPWAIVAIVLGAIGMVFGGVFRIPMFAVPAVIAIVFGMTRSMRRQSNPAPFPAGGSGSFSGRSSFGEVASSAAHGLVSTIGGFFLIASILSAICVVADLPGLLQSPLVSAEAGRHIEKSIGPDWPRLVREFGIVLCIGLGWIALLLTILGRRWGGGMHMVRAILGIGLLFAAIITLSHGLPPWSMIVPGDNSPGSIADFYVQHIGMDHAIWAGVIFLAGWILLVWPARRRDKGMSYPSAAPVANTAEGKGTP